MKLLEVEGARAPVPHSWRRHWVQTKTNRQTKATVHHKKIEANNKSHSHEHKQRYVQVRTHT